MQPAQNQLPVPSSTSLTAGLSKTSFRKPLVSASAVQNKAPATTEISIKQQAVKPVWLHNPHAEGAVVLNQAQWQQAGEGGAVWPVVVDPHVGRHLRPHQSQGVQFLYECIMGLREANRQAPARLLEFLPWLGIWFVWVFMVDHKQPSGCGMQFRHSCYRHQSLCANITGMPAP